MKQIIGSPARKDRFYKRPEIREDILDAIFSGENLLISAPRRVGKTSILWNLVDDPDPNIFTVYLNTEAIENPEEFFQMILNGILNTDKIEGFGNFSRRTKEFLIEWAKKIAGIKIGGIGIDFRETEKINFYDQLLNFLTEIHLEDKKIVILVDEFPITVEHIHRKYDINGVKLFLDQNRALRQNPIFQEKVKFIYCGSIGLFTVVKRLNSTDMINDLREIQIGALRKIDAEKLVSELLFQKSGTIPHKKIIEYILRKIEWWIPFYFQLLVKEMSDPIIYDKEPLSEKMVDTAFEKVIENGNIYFEHFKSRLSKTFEKAELDFVLDLLIALKSTSTLNFNEIINISESHNLRQQTQDILEILKYDGYIVEENKCFRFYSPILKAWWK